MRNPFKSKQNSRFKFRESALVFAGILTMVFVAGFASNASAVSLKQNTLIEGNTITLGHVFTGLDGTKMRGKAEKVLGPAPRPGQDMVLNARTLMRIAVAMDLPWRPTSSADQVVLSRAATVIPPSMVSDILKTELSKEGVAGNFELAFISSIDDLILPADSAQTMAVENVSFQDGQNRFTATIAAPTLDNPIIRKNVSGKIQRMTAVPVLNFAMKNGQIIDDNDIEMVNMRSSAIKAGMVLSKNELIGMTPRRLVQAGQPIKELEIQAPQIVKRGEMITMVFENGALSLTAQGKALESGAKGDLVRVTNISSSRNLEAEVTAFKEVKIRNF